MPEPQPAGDDSPEGVVRVLVADGDPQTRDALLLVLADHASVAAVGVADDAVEVARLAGTLRPAVALVDVGVPGGGPEAAGGIRTRSPDTQVLAMLAYDDRPAVMRMFAAGAVGYVLKSTPGPELCGTIRRVACGRISLSGSVATGLVDDLAAELERREREPREQQERVRRVERALEPAAFAMVFQPVVDLRHGQVVGVEALARFRPDPQRSPALWFAEAAKVGRQAELEVAAVRAAWSHLEEIPDGLYLSVNASPQTLLTQAFQQLFHRPGAERLMVELTEHAAVDDYQALGDALLRLRSRGARLAVDDAGAGYASLRHILRLDPDVVKLDVSLTRGIDRDGRRRALACALIPFAEQIGATMTAEGIETQQELDALRELGVSYGQGFFLGAPAPVPLLGWSAPAARG
ncbi:MAG TPA: EAL domain-containing protein [Egibacteraceae bacterium]|nr:EAL domain-containing protein [Actinomycetota bacterium]HWB73001.1 EAL domain-containing protein [Egibacteraceae bacterium]